MKSKYIFLAVTASACLIAGCGQPKETGMSASEQLLKSKASLDVPTNISGFDCIGDFNERIGMLGRGENYPEFLIADIKQELVRQDPRSKLTDATCTGEVQLKVSFIDVTVDGETTQALDMLSATFPMDINVDFDAEQWLMNIEHSYTVSNMASSETPEVTQQFKVLNTYDDKGNLLPGSNIKVIQVPASESE